MKKIIGTNIINHREKKLGKPYSMMNLKDLTGETGMMEEMIVVCIVVEPMRIREVVL